MLEGNLHPGTSLSVFFPAYNDAPSLPALLARTVETLREIGRPFEVVVVNDGSYDSTGEVLAELAAKYAPNMRIVTHEQNGGYGMALRSGFATAKNDLVFYTDGDGQYDPAEIKLLLAQWDDSVGLVNGYKVRRSDPWHRIAIGFVYNKWARLLFGVRLRDIDCDFRLVRRSLLDQLHLTSTSGTICVELVRKIELTGCRVAEVPVSHYPRLHGRSQFFRWKSLLTTLREIARAWFWLVLVPFATRRDPRMAEVRTRKAAASTL